MIKKQVEALQQRFLERTLEVKSSLSRPLTPDDEEIEELDKEIEKRSQAHSSDLLAGLSEITEAQIKSGNSCFRASIDSQSHVNTIFIFIQCICFGYNAWAIPFRSSFHIYQDPLYIFRPLGITLYGSFWIIPQTPFTFLTPYSFSLAFSSWTRMAFIQVSILPLDFLYFWTGYSGKFAFLRAPRLLRYRYFDLLFQRLDASTSFPLLTRLTRTINIMLFLIHLNTCAYFLYSDAKGIGSNSFVYDGEGFAYIRCFYLALKCSLSIGKNPKPDRNDPLELIFMGGSWLLGVFVFAVLIGNVKDIVSQSTRDHDEFMRSFDGISQYMASLKVEKATILRVKEWCNYTWRTQKSFNERKTLDYLPLTIKTDLALNVHFETVSKVKLFEGCDPRLLRDITQRLKPSIFLSGDYICRKGDIGKEMFIITTGSVQVVGGKEDSVVFVTLEAGVCFGEIALLSTGNMNRRTANVRAHGFTTLYTLFKDDLSECLNDYPEDRVLLAKKTAKAAKEFAQRSQEHEKSKRNSLVVVPLDNHRLARIVEKAIEARDKRVA